MPGRSPDVGARSDWQLLLDVGSVTQIGRSRQGRASASPSWGGSDGTLGSIPL